MQEESKSDRESLDNRFLFGKAIRIIVRKSGYLGIASAAGHRVSKRWNGYDTDDDFKWAFEEAFKEKHVYEAYTKINSAFSKLPLVRELNSEIQNFSDKEIDLIKECVLELFRIKMDSGTKFNPTNQPNGKKRFFLIGWGVFTRFGISYHIRLRYSYVVSESSKHIKTMEK